VFPIKPSRGTGWTGRRIRRYRQPHSRADLREHSSRRLTVSAKRSLVPSATSWIFSPWTRSSRIPGNEPPVRRAHGRTPIAPRLPVPASEKRASGRKTCRAVRLAATSSSRIALQHRLLARTKPRNRSFSRRGNEGASVHASRQRAARRPERLERGATGTPEGVTALSVARATDDRPEGECP